MSSNGNNAPQRVNQPKQNAPPGNNAPPGPPAPANPGNQNQAAQPTNNPVGEPPAEPRTKTLVALVAFRVQLNKFIAGNRKKFDLAHEDFKYKKPVALPLEYGTEQVHRGTTYETLRTMLQAASIHDQWWARPANAVLSENPLQDKKVFSGLAKTEHFVNKSLSKREALYFVPPSFANDARMNAVTDSWVDAYKATCNSAKSEFFARLISWIIQIVLSEGLNPWSPSPSWSDTPNGETC
ncbi:hypothetical protein G7Y89_g11695 [Cudoniella acicularis]|uniref:Uncharacterized protein n=1 Tax=Cudoniella acicularis TaxID=354080 RepID=A0A8H4RAC9_9HELO|nr:hypothetical protein G7Y89_g11695 [Cudoniella acicularis]